MITAHELENLIRAEPVTRPAASQTAGKRRDRGGKSRRANRRRPRPVDPTAEQLILVELEGMGGRQDWAIPAIRAVLHQGLIWVDIRQHAALLEVDPSGHYERVACNPHHALRYFQHGSRQVPCTTITVADELARTGSFARRGEDVVSKRVAAATWLRVRLEQKLIPVVAVGPIEDDTVELAAETPVEDTPVQVPVDHLAAFHRVVADLKEVVETHKERVASLEQLMSSYRAALVLLRNRVSILETTVAPVGMPGLKERVDLLFERTQPTEPAVTAQAAREMVRSHVSTYCLVYRLDFKETWKKVYAAFAALGFMNVGRYVTYREGLGMERPESLLGLVVEQGQIHQLLQMVHTRCPLDRASPPEIMPEASSEES